MELDQVEKEKRKSNIVMEQAVQLSEATSNKETGRRRSQQSNQGGRTHITEVWA